MKQDIYELQSILKENYKEFAQIDRLAPLSFNFNVNNQLYIIEANKEKYILKRMHVSNDFYGTAESISKLEMISTLTSHLVEKEFPIEEVISNREGKYLVPFKEDVIRIFKFYEGQEFRTGNKEDLKRIAILSSSLHSYPTESILNFYSDASKFLLAPYPLSETYLQSDWILEQLNMEEKKDWALFISNFSYIRARVGKLLEWEQGQNKVLTHMDFHPRNVILGGKKNGIMIDMDYLRLGSPFVCLGFTLTRFAFFEKKTKSKEDILNCLNDLLEFYPRVKLNEEEFRKNIMIGAMYMETEKIFRNLFRFYKTKQYRKFAEDVLTLHFPVFQILDSMVSI